MTTTSLKQKQKSKSATKNCRSNNVIERLRKTLLNYDLLIADIESHIDLKKEEMDFYCLSTKKSDLKAFAVAKIEYENYCVFLKRINDLKNSLLSKISLVVDKYQGKGAEIFYDYFFLKKSVDYISEKTSINKKTIEKLLYRMRKDIINYA